MQTTYSKPQFYCLILMRFLTGWQILYEGFVKLMNPQWSSLSFLKESKWILSGFAQWIVENRNILNAVDFLNTWGLIFIGLGLILGLFSRTAAITGSILIFVYFLNSPPLIGLEYSVVSDGSNLVVNKTLIEAAALFLLALFPTSNILGLDVILQKYFIKKNN